MNIFYSLVNLLQDFWHLLEDFVEHMHPQFIQDTNDESKKTE
jgi:hypothetical protein